jgi:nitrite reductase/ring-hydroxylating ferredoxin subunit
MKRFLSSFFILFTTLFFNGCNQSEVIPSLPNVPVNIRLNINNPSNFDLGVIGGWQYVNGGSGGIVVYRFDENTFKSYDRHCTYQPENYCIVAVDSTNFALEDPCSGSRFALSDGSVMNGPASYPLLQYSTTFDGVFVQISN